MKIELTPAELDALIDSLDYSQHAIREAQETPQAIRTENLARVEALASKLRDAKQGR
jgi:hypothetical protein